ncbi:MAG: UPF0149 family protein [Sulfuricella sp.]
MQITTMSEQEMDRLEDLLASDAFKNEAMTLDILQGFLCAALSGPETIPPSVWMPLALGESPEYESAAQAEEVASLIMKFHDAIASALSGGEDFDLFLYGAEDNPEQLDYAAWCEGYVYGAQIGEANWFEAAGEFAPDLSEKMEVFFLLSGMLKEDAEKNREPWLSSKEEAKALAKAEEEFPATIHDIYRFWQAQGNTPAPVRRESPKLGRNDPCSCGSGKKFKQCCGKSSD